MENRYFGQFKTVDDIHAEFSGEADVTDEEVLLAVYVDGGYSGTAGVIFKRNGNLFEVEADHCSCNDLTGQWDPKPVTWGALRMRLMDNCRWLRRRYSNEFADAFEALVNLATFWEEAETHD